MQDTRQWRDVWKAYLMLMEEDAKGDCEPRARQKETARKGEIKSDRSVGADPKNERRSGEMSILRRRVRYFSDGLVLGSDAFVSGVFDLTRHRFPPGRKDGPRPVRRVETTLRTLRDLRLRVMGSD